MSKPLLHIARWDLDKTYLRTDFDTVRELVRTALERVEQKKAVPGATTLMQELQKAESSVTIISGSPEQMRKRIIAKLDLDGVHDVTLVLKPNLRNLLKLRLRSLKGQLGYKLPTLLRLRALVDPCAEETLLGDDSESDAFIYSMYADIGAGQLPSERVASLMVRDRCHVEEITTTLSAIRALQSQRATPTKFVTRILIHLDRQTPPGEFTAYGPRVVPFYNYFQAALVLFEDGRIPVEGVRSVACDLIENHRFTADALVRSIFDLSRRSHFIGGKLTEFLQECHRFQLEHPRALSIAELSQLIAREDDIRTRIDIPLSEASNALQVVPNYEELLHAHNRPRKSRLRTLKR